MQLTRAADYAVRVMIHLATLPAGTKLRLKDLAVETATPEVFLAKVLQSLTRSGQLVSHRGPDGGFELAAHGRSATMLDVIESIDGPIQLNVCLSDFGCEHQAWCPAHLVWAKAQEAMVEVLRGSTIEELAKIGVNRKAVLAPAESGPVSRKSQTGA